MMENRYFRQMLIDSFGEEGQKKLGMSHAVVVGCGGLGSLVLTYLSMAGVGKITMIDSDVVGETNLNRQFLYEEGVIGRKKTDCALEFLQKRNSGIAYNAIHTRLTKGNAPDLCRGADVIVDCVDNDESRALLSRACLESGIPIVEAGVREYYGYVLPVLPGKSACMECIHFMRQPEKESIPILGSVAGVVGSIQATESLKILLGISVTYGAMVFYDGLKGEFEHIPVQTNPECICQRDHASRQA